MFAKINHVAIISERYTLSCKFYEAVFGMKSVNMLSPTNAVVVGDGYVGMNIIPRYVARPARLDHFGIEVADVETAYERMRKRYPRVEWLKRPANRPFAGVTTHDPDGNVFDLSQKKMANRTDIYEAGEWKQNRYISRLAFRTLNPEAMAEFYSEVFELEPRNRAAGDPNHYLTDGHVTLAIMPWHITDYDGTGIVSPGMDHVGFTVESLDALKADIDIVCGQNPMLAPRPTDAGPEGKARLALARRSNPAAQEFIADLDGVLLAIAEQ